MVCEVVGNNVFRFCPAQEVLLLTTCCKRWHDLVDWEIVVRCAFLGSTVTGHKNAMALLGIIHLPQVWPLSPLRLIRVSCGRRCEISGKTCRHSPAKCQAPFGVFACEPCGWNYHTWDMPACNCTTDNMVLRHLYGDLRSMYPDLT